jgi:hypothetical protein
MLLPTTSMLFGRTSTESVTEACRSIIPSREYEVTVPFAETMKSDVVLAARSTIPAPGTEVDEGSTVILWAK